MKLSVIVVSYNTKDLLENCLDSVFASITDFNFDVWVVDNASSDGSPGIVMSKFPEVNLIANQENLGFSRANNLAIKKTNADYVLLLNSDVEVEKETLQKMVDYMDEHRDVGVSSCKVTLPNGQIDPACRRSFPTPWVAFTRFSGLQSIFPNSRFFARYNLTFLPENKTAEVDSVMGAFLLISNKAVRRAGLLDESFWMYGEDIDLCYRVKQAGFKVMYVPITEAVHHKGSSSKKVSEKALYEFHRAMIIFYNKHFRKKYPFFVDYLVVISVWMVYYVRAFINFFRQEKYVSKQK